jgi:predicted RNase H-like HicB family nuclease
MKFLIMLDRDEDGAWVAECPSIAGCISQMTTNDEATATIQEAILGYPQETDDQGTYL